jgi:hypothetical protein
MATRRHLLLVLAAVVASMGPAYRTTNFVVDAPNAQLAQQFAEMAERYRREKAQQWLGYEMPTWPEPCPVKVVVTMGGAGGATSFAFDRGRVLGQHMNIEGSLDRLLVSVLPHEVTHTVFAYYFRCPLPRWADEGGAVLSEDDIERDRHDRLCRQILNTPRRAMPLRRLFALRDYPDDVMALYAQGYSVVNFLVNASNRQVFLAFVGDGMRYGWDHAAQAHYHYTSVEQLEEAWLAQLRATRRQPPQLARNTAPAATGSPQGSFVRQTLPPAQPLAAQPEPIFRGQAPGQDQERGPYDNPGRLTAGRPGYLPQYNPDQPPPAPSPRDSARAAVPRDDWQPAGQPYYRPPSVRLGAPQMVPPPQPQLGPPSAVSPVGYPN